MPGCVIGNFFVYSVINAFTPGPGNILVLNTVTNYGWKKGLPLFFGISSDWQSISLSVGRMEMAEKNRPLF